MLQEPPSAQAWQCARHQWTVSVPHYEIFAWEVLLSARKLLLSGVPNGDPKYIRGCPAGMVLIEADYTGTDENMPGLTSSQTGSEPVMQLTLKVAVATHVLDVFTGWFTPSTGLARVLQIICQKSHNLVRLSDEYILCCDLDYENFDLELYLITLSDQYKGALLPPWINFNPSMDK